MPWPFRSKAPTRASFSVGSYRLDAPVGNLTGLVEFSAEEYADMGRQFKGEKNYNAPPVQFLGRTWRIMIQTVNGQICKIAPYIELTSKLEADHVAMEELQYSVTALGNPNEQKMGALFGTPPMEMLFSRLRKM